MMLQLLLRAKTNVDIAIPAPAALQKMR